MTLVVVHGRDQDPAYMEEHFVEPLERPDLAYVVPAADARSWYPVSFLAPRSENEPRLGHALDRMDALRRELESTGVDRTTIVWVGFSQGACLVTEYVARAPYRFGALVALTGGLIGPDVASLSRPHQKRGMPVLFGTSDVDPFVPLARVEATAELFLEAGAEVDVAVYPGATHEIVADEILRSRLVVAKVEAGITARAVDG
ncbi:MAG: alpha/beta hydrolase [Acidimicrobiales bacterium]